MCEEIMAIQVDKISDREGLVRSYSLGDLKRLGFKESDIVNLQQDNHQSYRDFSRGYLGALVLNFLHRQGSVNGKAKENYLSAFLLSDLIGVDFGSLIEMKQGDRPLVIEKEVEGVSDLYVSVEDLHYLVKDLGSEDTLTGLATNYAHTKNSVVRERVAEKAQGNVRKIAARVYKKINGAVDLEDLVCDGNFGLLEAMESYDPERGTKFETHLNFRVKGAIIDGLRGVDVLKRTDRERFKVMAEFSKDFRQQEDRLPSYGDFKAQWDREGYPESSFEHFYFNVLRANKIESLNDIFIDSNGGKKMEKGQIVAAKSSLMPHRILQSKEALDIFERDLLDIPEKHRDILRMYLIEGIPLWEASESVGFSESRGSQIKTLYVESGVYFKRTREYLGLRTQPNTVKLDLD